MYSSGSIQLVSFFLLLVQFAVLKQQSTGTFRGARKRVESIRIVQDVCTIHGFLLFQLPQRDSV